MTDARGFTVLEVLVALTILVIGLGGFYRIWGGSVLATDRAARERHAAALVDNLVAELGRTRPLTVGRTTGTLPDGQAWELRIETYATRVAGDSDAAVRAFLVQIDVGARPYRFDTLLLAHR